MPTNASLINPASYGFSRFVSGTPHVTDEHTLSELSSGHIQNPAPPDNDRVPANGIGTNGYDARSSTELWEAVHGNPIIYAVLSLSHGYVRKASSRTQAAPQPQRNMKKSNMKGDYAEEGPTHRDRHTISNSFDNQSIHPQRISCGTHVDDSWASTRRIPSAFKVLRECGDQLSRIREKPFRLIVENRRLPEGARMLNSFLPEVYGRVDVGTLAIAA